MTLAVGRQSFLDAQWSALETWGDYIDARRDLELALGAELDGVPREG